MESIQEGSQKLFSEFTASVSSVFTITVITAAFYYSSNRSQKIESMTEGVRKMRSESAYYNPLHIYPEAQSNDFIIPKLHNDNMSYFNNLC